MSSTAESQPRTKKRKSKKTETSIRKRRSRFINVQRHKSSCGPIAIANAIKWHSVETSYDAVLKFCAGIKAYHPRKGMWPFQMIYALKILRIPFKKKRKFTIADLDAILASGGALILAYDTSKSEAHAAFVDASNGTHYRVWNHKSRMPPWIEKKYLEEAILRSSKRKAHLYAFVFAKPEPHDKVV